METLTIYYGKPKPLKAKGRNQCHLLHFAFNYRGWHSMKSNCAATMRAVKALKDKGYIEVNSHNQFRLKEDI